MPKVLGIQIEGAGVRREILLIAVLAVAIVGWILFRNWQTERGVAQPVPPTRTDVTPAPVRAGAEREVSKLQLGLIKKHGAEGEAAAEDRSRRNPFVFVKPKPKPVPKQDVPIVPVKPRPSAEYQGYLLAGASKYALVKMNNDPQVYMEGARLPTGYTLAKVDPLQIVLKDSDGESYSFSLPR